MKLTSIFVAYLSLAAITQAAPTGLTRRRFGQEHTPQADATFQAVKDIAQGTDKEAQAGNLSGAMVRALLAAAPACDQQDRADEVIDLGKQLGGNKQKQLIKVAKTYRQLERNTPKAGQPSALCNKKPRNKELDGLTQAQDPTGNTGGNSGGNTGGNNGGNTGGNNGGNTGGNTGGKKGKNIAETNPVGGVKMPKIKKVNGDFVVNGNGFNGNLDAAHSRQCDVQHNLCFNKLNSGDKSFTNQDCDNQTNVCKQGPPVFA